jgi:putative superfamily III holin-X
MMRVNAFRPEGALVTSSASPARNPTPQPAHAAPPTSLTKADQDAAPAAARSNAKHAAEQSVGQLVSDASTHLSTLIRGEIELAKLELRSTVKNAGTGVGLFAAAAVVLVFSLTFGFFALAEGLAAAGIWRWAAFLIVFGLQLLAVGLCVFLGVKKVKRVKAPELTIKTTKETVDYLKKSRE